TATRRSFNRKGRSTWKRSLGLGSCGFGRTVSGFWAASSPATVRRERFASDGIAVFLRRPWANGSKLFRETLPSRENVIVPMPDCRTFEGDCRGIPGGACGSSAVRRRTKHAWSSRRRDFVGASVRDRRGGLRQRRRCRWVRYLRGGTDPGSDARRRL